MKQLYEVYARAPKLSSLVTELSWTNNLLIISRTKDNLEREFYLNLAIQENLSKRALERAINVLTFERSFTTNKEISPVVIETHPTLNTHFNDLYLLDFLDLPDGHSERDLQTTIMKNLRNFILELGSDFIFIAEEYRLQVANTSYVIDLLFFHRELQCLVAIDLKVGKFFPEHAGKMNFYLEALDQHVEKPHENPSVGIILCQNKDDQVVKYTLGKNMSPTLVAEYETKLIPKEKLKAKISEIYPAIRP